MWKNKPRFKSDANLLITKGASWWKSLGLFLICVYLKEIENKFICLGVAHLIKASNELYVIIALCK